MKPKHRKEKHEGTSMEKIEKEVVRTNSQINLKKKNKMKPIVIISVILGIIFSSLIFIFTRKTSSAIAVLIAFPVLMTLFRYFREVFKKSARVKKIEEVFPDFLQLMSSNLRAGMTIDKAMLLSARKEFAPLDEEILRTGRDITTGKTVESSLLDMGKRINSDRVSKTILLLISGIRAGGNIAVLIEETSMNMRQKGFVEKKASSNVLMYVIFIFVAVAVGAPLLFGLSNILVQTLSNLLSGIPQLETNQLNLPFSLTGVNISLSFVKYFSITFILVIDILASLVLGLVNKGEEKEGLKYLIPILLISMVVFFAVQFFLAGFIEGLFG